MNKPTREDLLGFVLGALDAQEQQYVADYLSHHPEFHLELQRLQAQLVPLESCRPTSPDFPAGLARRTCEIVARESRQTNPPIQRESTSPIPSVQRAPRAVLFNRPVRNRAQLLQSALMVCCSAILGAAIGPLAYGALNNSTEPRSAPLAVNRALPEPQISAPLEPTTAPDRRPNFEVAYIGHTRLPVISIRNVARHSEPNPFVTGKRNQSLPIRFISK